MGDPTPLSASDSCALQQSARVEVIRAILAQGVGHHFMGRAGERRTAMRKVIAALNSIARKLKMKTCDRDAGIDDINNLRRRLLLRLHSDKHGGKGTTHPLWHDLQSAWDEWTNHQREPTFKTNEDTDKRGATGVRGHYR